MMTIEKLIAMEFSIERTTQNQPTAQTGNRKVCNRFCSAHDFLMTLASTNEITAKLRPARDMESDNQLRLITKTLTDEKT